MIQSYEGISKINKIRHNAQKTVEIAAGLKKGREDIIEKVNDINRQIDETINQIKISKNKRAQQQALGKQKYDLSKWEYSELRDAINTSCDIELLELLKYRQPKQEITTAQNRYFRIPFMRVNAPENSKLMLSRKKKLTYQLLLFFFFVAKPGLWYAHFDGQWIAKQMELHSGKPPILLTEWHS
uniref:Myosin VI cargo binding domain-containing protein n=1 Tax=Glossina palpalis gambiensis TaxID=67801 RepID=A0A1B0BWC9_9MUSC